MGQADFPAWVHILLVVLAVGAQLLIAVAAVYRFRLSPSGILLGGGSLLGAIVLALVPLLHGVLLREVGWDHPARMATLLGDAVLRMLVGLAVALGIAFIPRSLRRLRR